MAALAAIDADVFGLIEIENNDGLALDTLVAALNDRGRPGHLRGDRYRPAGHGPDHRRR